MLDALEIVKEHPWVLVALLILLVLVIALLAYVVLIGREVQLWGLKIGARPSDPPKTEGKSGGQISEVPPARVRISDLETYKRHSRALDSVKVEQIEGAKDEIWLIGATMHYTIGNSKSQLIEKIQKGVDIYVLMADPEGEDFGATARSFGQEAPDLKNEAYITIRSCEDIIQEIEKSGAAAKLEVRLLDRVFTCGAYFFDPKRDSGALILVPHVSGYDAPVSPGFLFRPGEQGTLNHYYEIYCKVFSKSMSLAQWKIKYPAANK